MMLTVLPVLAADILEVAPLAPLHNYGEAAAIEYCREKYPELPNVV